ncbi:indolepyruvate oxidoreductase subunit beta [Clostridium oceanicum]|uniref:Indolepyruvate oxidoreductase subunit beta n=1 Tax=Clostridium oceanicum TaxID=1543 RepID=A0ABP3V5E9_9CLOT
MQDVKSVLFVGVGGQGTILASKIFTAGLLNAGYDVKMSEVHGMAQRGGTVSTQVRFGDKVYSPLIGKGSADVIVAFEKSEAARWLPYLKKDGYLVINDYELYPVPVLIGQEKYPDKVIEKLEKAVDNTIVLDASNIAKDLGNMKAQNVVLLGGLIKAINLEEINWNEVIEKLVPKKAIELNKKALCKGMGK